MSHESKRQSINRLSSLFKILYLSMSAAHSPPPSRSFIFQYMLMSHREEKLRVTSASTVLGVIENWMLNQARTS